SDGKQGGRTSTQKLPHIDDFEKSYQDAMANAKAAVQGKTSVELRERQHSLEDEQSNLWCQIALHTIADQEWTKKPLYRFQPYILTVGPTNVQRTQATKAAVIFMQTTLAASTLSEREPSEGFTQFAQSISDARDKLDLALLKYLSVDELHDSK